MSGGVSDCASSSIEFEPRSGSRQRRLRGQDETVADSIGKVALEPLSAFAQARGPSTYLVGVWVNRIGTVPT